VRNTGGRKILKLFGAIAIVASLAIAAAILYLLPGEPARKPARPPDSAVRSGEGQTAMDVRAHGAAGEKKKATAAGGMKVAVLIDDIGMDRGVVRELLKIHVPITFAVLPFSPHAFSTASILHENGREILLHLPMEPRHYPEENPGKGALLLRMNDDEIQRQLTADLDAVPHISGVNNHMGSGFMEHEDKVGVVMQELRRRNLFFVDSRTTPNSRGPGAARRYSVRFASRNVFLDSARDHADAFRTLLRLYDEQENTRRNPALVIGHPYRETVQALKEVLPVLQKEGMEFVSVSNLVR